MVYLFLADGFEECEALIPLDILKRADVEIKTVGVTGKYVEGAHGITVKSDISPKEISFDEKLEGIILPGGMPGTLNLEKSVVVQNAIDFVSQRKLLLCAICAAPSILGHKGLLKNKKATCFPGFENDMPEADIIDSSVVTDDNIITAKGVGVAFDFGFEILTHIKDRTTAQNLKKQMQFNI